MNNIVNLNARIRDRLTEDWLTHSESAAWTWVKRLDAPHIASSTFMAAKGQERPFWAG